MSKKADDVHRAMVKRMRDNASATQVNAIKRSKEVRRAAKVPVTLAPIGRTEANERIIRNESRDKRY